MGKPPAWAGLPSLPRRSHSVAVQSSSSCRRQRRFVLRASRGAPEVVAAEWGRRSCSGPTFLPQPRCAGSAIPATSAVQLSATRPGRRCLMQALALLPLGETRLLRHSVGLKRSPSCSQSSIQHLTGAGNPPTFLSTCLASEVLPRPPGGQLSCPIGIHCSIPTFCRTPVLPFGCRP